MPNALFQDQDSPGILNLFIGEPPLKKGQFFSAPDVRLYRCVNFFFCHLLIEGFDSGLAGLIVG